MDPLDFPQGQIAGSLFISSERKYELGNTTWEFTRSVDSGVSYGVIDGGSASDPKGYLSGGIAASAFPGPQILCGGA